MSLVLATLSALAYGLADFAGGFASKTSRLLPVLAWSQAAGSLFALAFILLLGQAPPAAGDLAFSLAAGLSGLVGLFALYRGIAGSIVAVVSPVAALLGAAIPVAFALARGERPSALAFAGAALCLPAIVLLSWSRPGSVDGKRLRSALLHGLAAGAGFGGFFVALALTAPGSGLWPVFAARLASLAVVGTVLVLRREKPTITREGRPWTLAAGLSDMGANILFLLASRGGLLSLVSVISSLFPAPTVILARVVLGERVPPLRILGLVLAVAGVALMSLR